MSRLVLDDDLIDEVASGRDDWLVLDPHPEFPGHWAVDSLSPFFTDFEDLIGPYRALWPQDLEEFEALAQQLDYRVAFGEDPMILLDRFVHLDDPPPFSIVSRLPDTVGGLLPYQLQGYNYLRDVVGGSAVWSTGTGKSVLAAAMFLHGQDRGLDLGLFVAKDHNTINVQRAMKRLAGLDFVLLKGTPKQRIRQYADLLLEIEQGNPVLIVTNYEKLKDDEDVWKEFVTDRRMVTVWDEMSVKLKNRNTQLYHAIARILYTSSEDKRKGTFLRYEDQRPADLRQLMTTATPIKLNPADFYNAMRLMDPRPLGIPSQFNKEFVKSFNHFKKSKPEKFKNLDKMRLLLRPSMHVVDKESDPEVAKYFPRSVKEPYYIDWDRRDRRTYDLLADELEERARARASGEDVEEGPLTAANVLGMIGVMQMLCDAPTMVADSARAREASWEALEDFDGVGTEPVLRGSETAMMLLEGLNVRLTNDRHTKLATLRMFLTERHADEKALVYTVYGEKTLLPILSAELEAWDVSHVVYGGTPLQRQEALDSFKRDPGIQVFLSSDKGSDSIDLEEARIGFNYDLPYDWATKYQRENRNDRVITLHEELRWYDLLMADSVEDRRAEIIAQKYAYHRAVVKGKEPEVESRAAMDDWIYVLTGKTLEDLLA